MINFGGQKINLTYHYRFADHTPVIQNSPVVDTPLASSTKKQLNAGSSLVSRGQTLYQLQHGCITSSARRRKGLVSACTGFRCIPQECELQYLVCIAYGSVVLLSH